MVTISRHPSDDAEHDPRVAAVLAAAAAPTEPGPVPGEDDALAAFRAAVPTTRRNRMLPSVKAAAIAATATGALLTGGVAAAGTGALPGTAQDTAKTILGNVGVTVPGPNEKAADNSTNRGRSADAPARKAAREAAQSGAESGTESSTDANSHGKAVSELATTTTLTGHEKGAAISELASGGKSHAGDEHPTPTESASPVSTESGTRGQSTAATASNGHSTQGRAHHTP